MSRKYLPEYLAFTRKERRGIIAVGLLILLFTLLPFLFPFFIPSKRVDHVEFEKEIAALKMKEPDSARGPVKKNYESDHAFNDDEPSEKNYYAKQPSGELFFFDPNTLPEEGWKKLGIREKAIATIQNYVSKGGKFYKPEDIGKIWGLHEDEVSRLLPYVRIEQRPADNLAAPANRELPKTYDKPKYTVAMVDINTADSSAFIALPGIGSKLANRIIAFRDKLGGFYKIEQVAETYALPDSTFQKIKNKLVIGNTAVKRIDINAATVDELKIHPYIRYTIANAIVQYRLQHGAFSAVSDLKKIMMITEEIYSKLEPYLFTR